MDLAGLHLCQVNNNQGACTPSRDIGLSGTLAAGGVLVLCNQSIDPSILPAGAASCDVFERNVMTFNGDDRLLLYHEEDGTTGFGAMDRALDAFGQLAALCGLCVVRYDLHQVPADAVRGGGRLLCRAPYVASAGDHQRCFGPGHGVLWLSLERRCLSLRKCPTLELIRVFALSRRDTLK